MTNPTSDELADRLEMARIAAQQAGNLTLSFFQQDNFQVERKADNSPVTEADCEAEQLLRHLISAPFPDDGIVGEEFETKEGSSPFTWILDPIDGTKSFISGVPLYGTLVGVEHEGEGVIGVIYIPALGECVFAAKGQGAWYTKNDCEPLPARVSSCDQLADGLFLTSQVDLFAQRGAGDAFHRLEESAYITRTWGDCYGFLLVATGRAEAIVDGEMNVWDAAPMQAILQEAGGTFTDWQGNPTIHGGEGIATNGHVLKEVLAVTGGYPKPS